MLRVTVPPTGNPLLSLDEIKAHLRIESDDTSEDAGLTALGALAVEVVEGETHRAYAERTLDWVLPGFADRIRLPLAPVIAVEAVTYTDLAGAVQTLDPAQYGVQPSGEGRALVPRWGTCWPCVGQGAEPVRIVFRAGGATALPPRVRQAALLLCGHYYEHRESVAAGGLAELPQGVDALLSPERWA